MSGQHVAKEKLQRATPALAGGAREELRCEMTPAEKILWEELRANKLGVHFHPLCPSDISPKYDNGNSG